MSIEIEDRAGALVGPGGILPAAAAKFPDKVGLRTAARVLTFAELDSLATRVAAALTCRGIGAGDRVSILAANRWEWIVTYHGALIAGTIVNPINAMLTAGEVAFVLRDCGSSALFVSGDRLADISDALSDVESLSLVVGFDGSEHGALSFEDLVASPADGFRPVPVDPKGPSTIGYTSGTTGHPKGAIQSHEAVLLNCQATATMHSRNPDDILVTALPAPHVYGNVAINATFLAGGTVVLMERFAPGQALELIAQQRATLFEGVPAMYSMMLNHPGFGVADLTSITRSTVGGQTIATAVVDAWQEKTGAPVLELWGMTELSGLGTTHWHDQPPVPGSIGVALPGLELRVADLDDASRDVSPGTPGELMARGPHVMLGYYGDAKATSETIEGGGWLHTGDVATVDDSGHYFIVDRRKDMIITAGYNIYPAEIERVLAAHPDVAMVAVGSIPDEVKGELAQAYIVTKPGTLPTTREIMDFARQHLAAYKVPRSVRFVTALPQTSSGKIMRRKLSEIGSSD